jgi:N-acyl homoserine lactone hydrolase
MTQVKRFWPLLTGIHRYEKTLSTRNRGHGQQIEAPILAYLIETANGRILYDVGCDYTKINDPGLRRKYYENEEFPFGPPVMTEEDRLVNRLARLDLTPEDIDVAFIGHLHFDHGGGLLDVSGAEIHVHEKEWHAANEPADSAYFPADFSAAYNWRFIREEYELVPGVRAIESPGHTAGHMSLYIELPKGAPIILTGDAADLQENLRDEVAPGLCWHDHEELAIDSIRKLKRQAQENGAELWPNHDMAFYRSRKRFPGYYE